MKVPPYPFHLTPAERDAIAEKAARDIVEHALPHAAGKGTVTLRTVMTMIAPLTVAVQWASQHVADLEGQIKELKNAVE